jgi:hypothetical protein
MAECCVKKDAIGLIAIQTKSEPVKTRVWPPLLSVLVLVLIYLFLERGTNYLVGVTFSFLIASGIMVVLYLFNMIY